MEHNHGGEYYAVCRMCGYPHNPYKNCPSFHTVIANDQAQTIEALNRAVDWACAKLEAYGEHGDAETVRKLARGEE